MGSPSQHFLSQGEGLISDLAHRLEAGPFGSFSSSIYDTAWVTMICKPGDHPTWLFPQCYRFLLQAQNAEGGWPSYATDVDGILNTLAALLALKNHQKSPFSSNLPNDLETRIAKADCYVRTLLREWDVASTNHIAFEILVPSLLRLLESDSERFEFPGRQALFALNSSKLSKFSPELLYGKRETTLVHSLEAFVGIIDFDRVGHHLDKWGAMMASPSSTAAFLIYSLEWSEPAERYLQKVVASGQGIDEGGVPTFFPSSVFEVAWVSQASPSITVSLAKGKIDCFYPLQSCRHV